MEHEHEFISGCCTSYPLTELDEYLVAICGGCRDWSAYECESEECNLSTESLLSSSIS